MQVQFKVHNLRFATCGARDKKIRFLHTSTFLSAYNICMGQVRFTFFCAVFFLIPTILAFIKPSTVTDHRLQPLINKTREATGHAQKKAVAGARIQAATVSPSPFPAKTSTLQATITPPPGQSVKVDDTTWRITVSQDAQMGTQSEVFAALNAYRQKRGKAQLTWDDKLGSYAQSRADFFSVNGSMDSHAAFDNFTSSQNGFAALGFSSLGENSAYLGGPIEATRIIEVIFAGDAPHDNNQLDENWSHAGVGIHGQAVDVVFGGHKR